MPISRVFFRKSHLQFFFHRLYGDFPNPCPFSQKLLHKLCLLGKAHHFKLPVVAPQPLPKAQKPGQVPVQVERTFTASTWASYSRVPRP